MSLISCKFRALRSQNKLILHIIALALNVRFVLEKSIEPIVSLVCGESKIIALVAQLDRVSASEAECRVFESPRAHQLF